ncbi:MAG: M23 family metallopeptidase [Rhodospirillales bacterium]|nr:M23 family metallopeptidase [Rhodospirillales bacterium]
MSIFFPLNTSFGKGMLDDPDDANLVDRALRRLGVMRKPLFGSTNPMRDIYAGLERFQRDNHLAIDGFMRTRGPTAAKLAERLNTSLAEPTPPAAGNPWPWGAIAQATPRTKPAASTRPPRRQRPAILGTLDHAGNTLPRPPRPRIKPPPPPKVPTPRGPEESARIKRAMDALTQFRASGSATPVPGRKPEPPAEQGIRLLPPVDNPVIRNDPAGGGAFGASRNGGKRTHKGIDILAEPGTEVRAPVSGTVQVRTVYGAGHKFHKQFDSIWIDTPDGTRVKLFYVDGSELKRGQKVSAGDVLGVMQDRARHDAGMKNHVHIEVHRNGKSVDPSPFTGNWFDSKEE